MSRMSWKAALTGAVVVPAAVALVACGDTTVDSAELTSSQQSNAVSSASSSSSSASESASARRSNSGSKEPEINDPAAKQTDSAPSGEMPLSKDDEKYLDTLIEDKIDVKGVEDALIGAARAHCAAGLIGEDANVMVNAIAGQLIAQDRTGEELKAVSGVIAKAAEAAYC